MKCLFCSIINKEIAAQIVFEDKNTMAFLDSHPKAPGHTMVVPKNHSENILDLPNQEIEPVFSTVKNVTRKIKSVLVPDGFTIGINQGRAGGQVIDHLHIHIIPRFNNDGGAAIHSVVQNSPESDLETIAEKIRNG